MWLVNLFILLIFLVSNLALAAGGSASGGNGISYVEQAAIECAINHKRFTAWDWEREYGFYQVKTLQIVNAYTDKHRDQFSHVAVKLITDQGTLRGVISGKEPFSATSLPLIAQTNLPHDATLSMDFDTDHSSKFSGVLYAKRLLGPVAIPLSNCGLPGQVKPIQEAFPVPKFGNTILFSKSAPNSGEFTDITLSRDENNIFSVEKQTLSARESLGAGYLCTFDVYLGDLWAVHCRTPDRRPIGGTKRELIIVSYDGRTFYIVSRIFTTLAGGDEGELNVLDKDLFLVKD